MYDHLFKPRLSFAVVWQQRRGPNWQITANPQDAKRSKVCKREETFRRTFIFRRARRPQLDHCEPARVIQGVHRRTQPNDRSLRILPILLVAWKIQEHCKVQLKPLSLFWSRLCGDLIFLRGILWQHLGRFWRVHRHHFSYTQTEGPFVSDRHNLFLEVCHWFATVVRSLHFTGPFKWASLGTQVYLFVLICQYCELCFQ